MSSSSYKKFAHLQIPLEEIASATSNFSEANVITETGFGKAYKGQILRSEQLIDIFAHRLNRAFGQGEVEFWKEISMLSSLKHENVVSIVGFCDEGAEKIIITKLEANGSLAKFLKDPTLTWIRRLQISVGVAHALSYIFYDKGRDFSVIHRNIKSSRILLDDHWKPKLCDFNLSIYQKAARRHRLCLSEVCGTIGYCDRTYIESGTVSHKSDIYSYGVVLFEQLCGKKAVMVDKENRLLAKLVKSHYEGGRLDDLIHPDLRKQMDPQSFNIFSETAYHCLKEQRSERPNIDQVVIKLEKALEFQWKHENPVYSIVQGTTSKSLKGKNLEHLEIPLLDIEKATENFSEKYIIGSGAYGDVYKAKLDHFDSKNLLPLEGKNKSLLPKKRSTVAIKRILIREDNQGEEGFLAEIEMLTSCKHPNIVSLLGFCSEGRHMILVYEHASNGSLDEYLRISTGSLTNLTWVQRIKICIDVARGLNYLHTKIENDQRIIHRDIKSGNILLGDNWEAKVADFGLSKFRPENQQASTLYTEHIAGTKVYLDPEYNKTGKLKNASGIYSFGVVLFEMLSGRFANDPIFTKEDINGIAHVARQRFNKGTIAEMVNPRLMEETHENIFNLNKGPHQDSLNAFSKIAYQCVAETQVERPTAEVIVKKLEEALFFQENPKDNIKISLDNIKSATQNFSDDQVIGSGGFGKVYRGDVTHGNGCNAIAAKRLDRQLGQGEQEFLSELQILLEYKHENIIGLVGYCNEMGECIIVYEYAPRGSLDRYLSDNGLTWMKRLQICINIASGLDFLHGGAKAQEVVIHRDIKSANILLNDDWKAKITDFGLSLLSPVNKDMEFVIDNAKGTMGYCDPLYMELGFLTKESDIYSLGVVLLEILCGSLVFEYKNGKFEEVILISSFKRHYEKQTPDEMVFEGIKEQILPNSLSTFARIVYQCLHREREQRPATNDVLQQLKQALEYQMENTSGNTMDTANNILTAPAMNEFVPLLAQNVLMPSDSHTDKPEKFNGSNFKEWQQKMLFYLTTLNLVGFLTEDPPKLQEGDIQAQSIIDAWNHSDFLCRNYVLNGLVEALSNTYSVAKTAKELWESLERKYNAEDVDVVAGFLEYKMVDGKTVVDQVQELRIIIQGIQAEGMALTESFQVAAIIEKLPPAWVEFKKDLKQKRKEMSVEDLIVQLQIEEDNKLAEKRGYVPDVAKANVFEPDVVQTKEDGRSKLP